MYVDDTREHHMGVYLHPDHVTDRLCWEVNAVTRHHVAHGLWQGWTQEERILQPEDGFRQATVRWEIAPAATMLKNKTVVVLEEAGSAVWLIREGHLSRELRDEMNENLRRIGAGLWAQYWPLRRGTRTNFDGKPTLAAPALSFST
ncbi:hypothetical protein [Streptomyces acidiscabies]|uniref:hypothetical protein n=1 Tax=Streptomyces acidiscabies TaxID=42234 RepID=UPI00131E7AA6|nr:hypothetical protein [Streptomyces acidiscabies]